jgi:hypothetical protein
MATFTLGHGTKIEYSATENGTYNQLYAATSIPEIGGTPDRVSTDSLDNEKFHTAIDGLMPEVALDIPFNLDVQSAKANLKEVADMETAGTEYYFKITYTSGVIVTFRSKVRYSLGAANPNELETFTMHLSPVGEPVITVPTTSL